MQILCGSYAGSHSCREFIGAPVLPCPEDSVWSGPLWPLTLTICLVPSDFRELGWCCCVVCGWALHRHFLCTLASHEFLANFLWELHESMATEIFLERGSLVLCSFSCQLYFSMCYHRVLPSGSGGQSRASVDLGVSEIPCPTIRVEVSYNWHWALDLATCGLWKLHHALCRVAPIKLFL